MYIMISNAEKKIPVIMLFTVTTEDPDVNNSN